jgi:hypothetical protein
MLRLSICARYQSCGSWLACEEAIESNITCAWYTVFAGKPAPTGNMQFFVKPYAALFFKVTIDDPLPWLHILND